MGAVLLLYVRVIRHWCLGFLMCTQILMHVIVHGDCMNTERESAIKVDWEKNPLPLGGVELTLDFAASTWSFAELAEKYVVKL